MRLGQLSSDQIGCQQSRGVYFNHYGARNPADPKGRLLAVLSRLLSRSVFFGKAILMMELPRRYSTPSEGGRFAPILEIGNFEIGFKYAGTHWQT
jgi:hypothetical protein